MTVKELNFRLPVESCVITRKITWVFSELKTKIWKAMQYSYIFHMLGRRNICFNKQVLIAEIKLGRWELCITPTLFSCRFPCWWLGDGFGPSCQGLSFQTEANWKTLRLQVTPTWKKGKFTLLTMNVIECVFTFAWKRKHNFGKMHMAIYFYRWPPKCWKASLATQSKHPDVLLLLLKLCIF